MAKSFIDELVGYRVKVEREGREIVNVPGILALPGLFLAPKLSVAGLVAAPLLGCSVHLENDDGREVDVGKAVKEAVDRAAGSTAAAARKVREEIEKAWEDLSADDPEGCPEGEENEDAPADPAPAEDGVPTIHVHSGDADQE